MGESEETRLKDQSVEPCYTENGRALPSFSPTLVFSLLPHASVRTFLLYNDRKTNSPTLDN